MNKFLFLEINSSYFEVSLYSADQYIAMIINQALLILLSFFSWNDCHLLADSKEGTVSCISLNKTEFLSKKNIIIFKGSCVY
jgi:hypothetical protein